MECNELRHSLLKREVKLPKYKKLGNLPRHRKSCDHSPLAEVMKAGGYRSADLPANGTRMQLLNPHLSLGENPE